MDTKELSTAMQENAATATSSGINVAIATASCLRTSFEVTFRTNGDIFTDSFCFPGTNPVVVRY
jgi:hypothetical protein